jgi:hypothetical protein
MRVNVYAEELTDRVEIVSKEIEGVAYTGVRFYPEGHSAGVVVVGAVDERAANVAGLSACDGITVTI